jgi:hypothetical protein
LWMLEMPKRNLYMRRGIVWVVSQWFCLSMLMYQWHSWCWCDHSLYKSFCYGLSWRCYFLQQNLASATKSY